MQAAAEERLARAAALEAMQSDATTRCSDSMKAALRRDGFVCLRGVLPRDIVRQARKEINRKIGAGMYVLVCMH